MNLGIFQVGTFDSSGQFREDPVDSFKDPFSKDSNINQSNKTIDRFLKDTTASLNRDKLESISSKDNDLNSDLLNRNEHHKLIDDKNNKFLTNDLFNDLMGKSNQLNQAIIKPNIGDLDPHTSNLDLDKEKFTNNMINLFMQRQVQTQAEPQIELKSQPSNDKELNERSEFFDNFSLGNNLNPMGNQLNFGQLGFGSNKDQENSNSTLNNLLESLKQQQIQQKLNQDNQQIESTNEKLTKLTMSDKHSKNDVQSLLESIANKQTQQQQAFPSSSINPEFQKMFSLMETEKLLKEMKGNNSSATPTASLNEQLQKQQNILQLNKKNPYSNDDHQFDELNKLNTGDNLVTQWPSTADEEEDLKERQRNTVFPPNHEFGQLWFYKDPQNKVQGPFTSSDMLEWYRGGYFSMDLLVRKGNYLKISKKK